MLKCAALISYSNQKHLHMIVIFCYTVYGNVWKLSALSQIAIILNQWVMRPLFYPDHPSTRLDLHVFIMAILNFWIEFNSDFHQGPLFIQTSQPHLSIYSQP